MRKPVIGIPADRRLLGHHWFHCVGEKYIAAIVQAADAVPVLVPALGGALGGQVTTLFIYCILALGLNVMVGYTGLVHLGIAAFFGIGACLLAILTVPMYPFQTGFLAAAVVSVLAAAGVGLALGAPTLRLRGDYLAIVTLGFGEVVKVTLRNLEQITGGMKGLNPVPPPGAGVKVGEIGRAQRLNSSHRT